jgi:hypothetical protein
MRRLVAHSEAVLDTRQISSVAVVVKIQCREGFGGLPASNPLERNRITTVPSRRQACSPGSRGIGR